MAGFDKLYLITSEDYDTMKNTGSVIIGGETYTYNTEALYFTDKLSTELLDDTNSTKKFTTAANIVAWNAKQDPLVGDSSSANQNIKTVAGVNIMGTGNIPVITGIKINNGSEITPSNNVVSLPMDTAVTENSNNLVSSGAVFSAIEAVEEVAAGKTKSWAVSKVTNVVFDSTADSITASSSITDTSGVTVALSDVKIGDNFYVVETDLPDRWVSAITKSGDTVTSITLSKLEAAKMSDYATTNYVDNKNYIKTVDAATASAGANGTLQFVVSTTDIPAADRVANTFYIILAAD